MQTLKAQKVGTLAINYSWSERKWKLDGKLEADWGNSLLIQKSRSKRLCYTSESVTINGAGELTKGRLIRATEHHALVNNRRVFDEGHSQVVAYCWKQGLY